METVSETVTRTVGVRSAYPGRTCTGSHNCTFSPVTTVCSSQIQPDCEGRKVDKMVQKPVLLQFISVLCCRGFSVSRVRHIESCTRVDWPLTGASRISAIEHKTYSMVLCEAVSGAK